MYDTPVDEWIFVLRHHARLNPNREGCGLESLVALLTEAGRIAAARLAQAAHVESHRRSH